MSKYLLITPVKNEEKYLLSLAESIINQTLLPQAWVIVNSNSSDNSVKIINDLCEKYHWIHIVHQKNISHEKNHINFSYAVHEGYEYGKRICRQKNILYEYVGKIDADIIVSNNFFENLIGHFEGDHILGAASGDFYTLKSSLSVKSEFELNSSYFDKASYLPGELPDERLYRKSYLDSIGGFPISKYSPDSIMIAKIKMNGWATKSYEDVASYSLRPTTGIERNLWKSSYEYGKNRYYLDYSPFLVLLSSILSILRYPHYPAFFYLFGYTSSVLKRDSKIDDVEVRHYFKNIRIWEVLTYIKTRISQKLILRY